MEKNVRTEVLSSLEVRRAAKLLQAGELVAFPTETVYGLGAALFQPDAIIRLFQAKGRPQDNPLIAHALDLDEVAYLAVDIPDIFYRLAEAFWPGPLTCVLKRHPDVPDAVSAGLPTIAVRIPKHPIARKLIQLSGPLVAPSANLSGKPSSTSAQHVLEDFEGKIAAVLDGGPCDYGLESTVISLVNPKEPILCRPGALSIAEIERALGNVPLIHAHSSQSPVSPGMKYRHYAPQAPIRLFTEWDAVLSHLETVSKGKVLLLGTRGIEGLDFIELKATTFYDALRHADRTCVDEIVVFCDDKAQADHTLMNRIRKAAS